MTANSYTLGHEGSDVRESHLWRLSAINNWQPAVWGILQSHIDKQSQSMGSDEEVPAPGMDKQREMCKHHTSLLHKVRQTEVVAV